MKVREDFVTNSSSSSFICVAKIDKSHKFIEYIKEEYGKYGLSLLDKYLVVGKNIKETENFKYEEFREYCEDSDVEIADTDVYLQASFIAYTDEGETEGDDAWLYRHIPNEFKEIIYEGEAY